LDVRRVQRLPEFIEMRHRRGGESAIYDYLVDGLGGGPASQTDVDGVRHVKQIEGATQTVLGGFDHQLVEL